MLELPPNTTFYLEIVAFIVFAAALRVLIWKPTQQVLAERAKRTDGARSEALRMQQDVVAMKERLEAALQQAREAGSSAADKVRREAEAAERGVLEEARAEAARTLEDLRTRVAAESELARAAFRDQAPAIAQLAAEKILGRRVSA